VVDASAPNFERQLEVTTEVLAEIGAGDVPRLLVFNKIDRAGDPAAQAAVTATLLARWPDAIVMSARRPEDVARLRARLVASFARDLVEGEVRVPYGGQKLRGEIFAWLRWPACRQRPSPPRPLFPTGNRSAPVAPIACFRFENIPVPPQRAIDWALSGSIIRRVLV
jgi:hypothetical protein